MLFTKASGGMVSPMLLAETLNRVIGREFGELVMESLESICNRLSSLEIYLCMWKYHDNHFKIKESIKVRVIDLKYA